MFIIPGNSDFIIFLGNFGPFEGKDKSNRYDDVLGVMSLYRIYAYPAINYVLHYQVL